MKKQLLLMVLLGFIACFFLLYFLGCNDTMLKNFREVRGFLFGSFFVATAFLMLLQCFLVITLKKEIYATKSYLSFIKQCIREGLISSKREIYRGLININDLFYVATLTSIITFLSLITIGMFDNKFCFYICNSLVCVSLASYITTFVFVNDNLKSWFRHIEQEAHEEIDRTINTDEKKDTNLI